MKSTAIALLLAGFVAAPAFAQDVAKVNGVAIPQSRMDLFMRNLTAQGRPDTPELREQVKQSLINGELLAQEAARRGLEKNPEVASRLNLNKQEILANAYIQDVLRASPVNEDAIKKEYERVKTQLSNRKEYKARHILVEKEDEAKDIIAQIRKGASFEKLAGEKSRDQGSKARGGELDWSPSGNYVKPFGDALARLKKGQMTDAPVHSNFGWHVIRLDDERAAKIPGLEESKQQIQQMLQRQLLEKTVADLRAKAKIE